MVGGFIATAIMTASMYFASRVGAPKMDIAAMLGSLLGHGTPVAGSGLWWAGMVWHFVNGTIIFRGSTRMYAYGWVPGQNWLRGVFWGLFLWVAMELVFMPMTGNGVFSDHATYAVARVMGSLILNVIYGGILGAIAGEQTEHTHHIAHPA